MSKYIETVYCTCDDWEPCGCGNQPPYHCMYCCEELTPEQLEEAKSMGHYTEDY